MKPKLRPDSRRRHGPAARRAGVTALACAFLLPAAAPGSDIPDRSAPRFGGIYKVASSSDPMFPATAKREYFLDFGKGIDGGKLSGTVAISMRQNPNLQVRLMAWQYFPEQGTLVIGHTFSEGSRRAVVRAAWQMTSAGRGVVFERDNHMVVLQRPAPGDY